MIKLTQQQEYKLIRREQAKGESLNMPRTKKLENLFQLEIEETLFPTNN